MGVTVLTPLNVFFESNLMVLVLIKSLFNSNPSPNIFSGYGLAPMDHLTCQVADQVILKLRLTIFVIDFLKFI